MIVEYIDAHRDRFGVDPICTVLTEHGVPIATSTYYAAKARGPVSDTAWAEAHAANTVHQTQCWAMGRHESRDSRTAVAGRASTPPRPVFPDRE